MNWKLYNGTYWGYDDDTPIHMVYYISDEKCWGWLNMLDNHADEKYPTAQAAMTDADNYEAVRQSKFRLNDSEPILTPEELDEILGDRLYDERKDDTLVGW